MEYCERDNVIYRGEKTPGFKHARMTEFIVNGKWMPVKGDFGLKAMTFGQPMTEAEAKEFQGEGWPAEDPQAA
jgi:hypothetical protein